MKFGGRRDKGLEESWMNRVRTRYDQDTLYICMQILKNKNQLKKS